MRKVVFAINITADGYCDHRDGIPNAALHAYHTDVLRDASTILFGRITYQLMVPYWPQVARDQNDEPDMNEFARVFDSIDRVVFSTTLKDVGGDKARLLRGDLAEEVLRLRQQPGKNIGVGSLSLASQLSARGLIDEYHFVVHPVVAGKGPRMFSSVTPPESLALDLIESKVLPDGIVAQHYKKHA